MMKVAGNRVLAVFAALLTAGLAVAQQPDPFQPYLGCRLPDGLSVVETALLADGITSRPLKTILGSYSLNIVAGRRIMFAYPDEDFFANLKVEILPVADYVNAKKALQDNFDYLLASGDNSRNYALKPKLNGFEIEGLDRLKREGGVLGIYLLLDDARRTVTTIYFLNQEPPKRFKTMDEYATVRDRFLNGYTACTRKALESK